MEKENLIEQAKKLIKDFPALTDFGINYDNSGISINWPVYVNIRFDERFNITVDSAGYPVIQNDRICATFFCKGKIIEDRMTKIHVTVFK